MAGFRQAEARAADAEVAASLVRRQVAALEWMEIDRRLAALGRQTAQIAALLAGLPAAVSSGDHGRVSPRAARNGTDHWREIDLDRRLDRRLLRLADETIYASRQRAQAEHGSGAGRRPGHRRPQS